MSTYAKKHEVEAVIYYQTKLPEFLKAYASTLYANTNRENMINGLVSAFDFPYFLIKGSPVAAICPVPMLRTMGDTDLVVNTEDREKVHDILLVQGFRNDSRFSDRE